MGRMWAKFCSDGRHSGEFSDGSKDKMNTEMADNHRGIAVIPKTNNPNRLKTNLEVMDFGLSDAEMKEINALDAGLRFNDPSYHLPEHPIYIF